MLDTSSWDRQIRLSPDCRQMALSTVLVSNPSTSWLQGTRRMMTLALRQQIFYIFIFLTSECTHVSASVHDYVSACVRACLNVFLNTRLNQFSSICLSIYLSFFLSIYLSILSIYLSFCLSVCLSVYLTIYLSFFLDVFINTNTHTHTHPYPSDISQESNSNWQICVQPHYQLVPRSRAN